MPWLWIANVGSYQVKYHSYLSLNPISMDIDKKMNVNNNGLIAAKERLRCKGQR
jgi:hypothetical protein